MRVSASLKIIGRRFPGAVKRCSYLDQNVSYVSPNPEARFQQFLPYDMCANHRCSRAQGHPKALIWMPFPQNAYPLQRPSVFGHSLGTNYLHARCMSRTSIEFKVENNVVRFSMGNLLDTKGSPTEGTRTSIELKVENNVVRFSMGNLLDTKGSPTEGTAASKRHKMSKKVKMSKKAKRNQLRFYRLKARKKMKSPNPEVRIRYKLEKAKRKEAWLIEKLRKFEVRKAPPETHDPEILTKEERFYLKRTGEKKKHYVPVGRRGVFGGVVLNMHLHWKKHETVKVVCKPCKPGQIHEYAEELARLSKGIVIDKRPDNIIIFYRGKNYVFPEVMSPPDTLSKAKALEKYTFEQSLEHTSQFIEKLENELEEYHMHLARYRRGKEKEKIVTSSQW